MKTYLFLFLCFLFFQFSSFGQKATLKSAWFEQVSQELPHAEYPRPQLVRENWVNLNGPWEYTIQEKGEGKPSFFEGGILVPFAVESSLSGVQKTVGPEAELWYMRDFDFKHNKKDGRVLLHFGAVDWEAEVWVNDRRVGIHQGGFDAFSFDITDYLSQGKSQELVLRVWDPSDEGPQPRGKQKINPSGIWYTPVTGIWQTVWMEVVPETRLTSLRSDTRWEDGALIFYPRVSGNQEGLELEISLYDEGKEVVISTAEISDSRRIILENPKPWSPTEPNLYDVKARLLRGNKVIDEISSYAAYRDIRMGKDDDGFQRMFLNGKALFQYGPLDQGWWPDGLYTAPTDEALAFDIAKTKEMGFNMIRKHVKVEPARWYYHADKLGMLVWQDMPSGDMGNRWEVRPGIVREGMNRERTAESEAIFITEWTEIMNQFKFFPSIVVWVPFNEAWGQFKTKEIVELTKELDPTRLINSASGGNFLMEGSDVVGDILDLHNYPDPILPDPGIFGENKIMVLGEFGGLGLPLDGHTWQNTDNWGYQRFKTKDELKTRYAELITDLKKYIPLGLAAAIYTQTTDVEIETNGLMTYDRKLIKMEELFLKNLHKDLYK